MVISMDTPEPVGALPSGPLMKMAMQIWNAKPEEALRVPALRQWAGYAAYTNYLMNPLTALQKVFASMPGSVQGFASMMEEKSKGLLLKSHTRNIYAHAEPARSARLRPERPCDRNQQRNCGTLG